MFKAASRAVAYWSGLTAPDDRAEPVARILCFHGTPKYQAAEFERQLRYLKRHFTIVSLRQLHAKLQTRSDARGRLLALTFDDGLRNNVSVAYPILRRLEIPATFFVCPELIEHRCWLWNHRARQRLRFASEGLRREIAEQYDAPCEVDAFIAWMKTLDRVSRRVVEKTLRDATLRYVPSAAERHEFDLAGWQELRAVEHSLVTIGSHGMSHAILPCLKPEEVEHEVAHSRRMIEARLERAVEFFAYPNGDHSPLVVECARRHYTAAVDCSQQWVQLPYDLHVLARTVPPRGLLRLVLCLNEKGATQRSWRPPKLASASA
jgi:peptidoglycan/xylan/chitin deacetylase (PgdA/CDA1 family)